MTPRITRTPIVPPAAQDPDIAEPRQPRNVVSTGGNRTARPTSRIPYGLVPIWALRIRRKASSGRAPCRKAQPSAWRSRNGHRARLI